MPTPEGLGEMWICRAEGTLPDGRKGNLDCAIPVWQLERFRGEEREYRSHAEQKVLVEYFRAYDQVPYRVFWLRDGREWLEPVPNTCCWVEDESAVRELEMNLRDTRDRTVRGG